MGRVSSRERRDLSEALPAPPNRTCIDNTETGRNAPAITTAGSGQKRRKASAETGFSMKKPLRKIAEICDFPKRIRYSVRVSATAVLKCPLESESVYRCIARLSVAAALECLPFQCWSICRPGLYHGSSRYSITDSRPWQALSHITMKSPSMSRDA